MVVKRGYLLRKIRKKGAFAMQSAAAVGSSLWMLVPELTW